MDQGIYPDRNDFDIRKSIMRYTTLAKGRMYHLIISIHAIEAINKKNICQNLTYISDLNPNMTVIEANVFQCVKGHLLTSP